MSDQRISVIFPYRAGEYNRERSFKYVYNYYLQVFEEFSGMCEFIIVDDPDPEFFNRGRAANEGVRQSCGDLLIILDADTLLAKDPLLACLPAAESAGFVVPFRETMELNQEASNEVLNGGPIPWGERKRGKLWSQKLVGRANIFTRDSFEYLGGFDPNFRGWGYEDAAMHTVAEALGRPVVWTENETAALHLWHPPAFGSAQHRKEEGLARCRIYEGLIGNPEGMRELVRGWSRYAIKPGYIHRDTPNFFDDTPQTDGFQKEVYAAARREATHRGWSRIADVGCGSGYKLVKNFPPPFTTTGYDLEPTLSWLKKQYPDRAWRESTEWALQEIVADLVICADVIEHVHYPDRFLNYLSGAQASLFLISTPDRDRVRPQDHMGPPPNECHMREWNQKEFEEFLSGWFKVMCVQCTNERQGTILAWCRPKADSGQIQVI